TTVFTNVKNAPYSAVGNGLADDTAAIQAALNACPANQVVYIPAGRYRISGVLTIPGSITVRGAGPGLTIIDAHGSSGLGVFTFGPGVQGDGGQVSAISGGSTAGSTSITVSSTTGISVGALLMIDELNDTTFVTKNGYYGVCNWCSRSNG